MHGKCVLVLGLWYSDVFHFSFSGSWTCRDRPLGGPCPWGVPRHGQIWLHTVSSARTSAASEPYTPKIMLNRALCVDLGSGPLKILWDPLGNFTRGPNQKSGSWMNFLLETPKFSSGILRNLHAESIGTSARSVYFELCGLINNWNWNCWRFEGCKSL